MKISQNGIDLIKMFEGCHLTAYKCPSGAWTIGYGHTAGVKEGMKITRWTSPSGTCKEKKRRAGFIH